MTEHQGAAPFRVLGIALVVDQRGKEARTVLRYPTSNHQQHQQQHQRMHQLAVDGAGAVDYPTASPAAAAAEEEEHLFYKLPGHQMAKLFRPKPPLCGRPMTLSVGGTVFCCCAVLMDEHDKNSSTTGKKNNKDLSDCGYQSSDEITDDDLILFSVIVALAPHIESSLSSSIPTAGWMEAGYGPGMTTAADLLQGFHSYLDSDNVNPTNNSTAGTTTTTGDPSEKRVSASFLSIRRVHVSLSRLCRILEREERRCRYVSVQANLFDQIRHDLTSSSNNISNKYSYWQNHHNDTTTISNSTDDADNLCEDLDGSESKQQHLSPKASGAAVAGITSAPETSSNLANISQHSSPPLPLPSPCSIPPQPSSSSASIGPTTTTSAPTTRHRRAGSNLTVSFDRDITPGNKNTSTTEYSKKQQLRQEKDRLLELEQVILETCMAAPPTRANVTFSSGGGTTACSPGEDDTYHSTTTTIEHLGNLARELVQVYHALGRNEHDFPPTPSTLLSGRDGVVYINRHVAFAIETVSTASLSVVDPYFDQRVQVRPYHTLLFPNASPSELLDSMNPIPSTTVGNSSTVFSTPSRRLQQLLRMVHPQKSLTDIATDAHLPVSTALDLAAYLVGQGAGLASPVITRAIRLATPHGGMARLRRAALPFRQYFHCDCVSLVELVAFLTDPAADGQPSTLGERLTHLTTAQNDNATVQRLREGLRSCWATTTTTRKQHSNNSNNTEVGSTPALARRGSGNGAHIFASMDSAASAFVDDIHGIPSGGGDDVRPRNNHGDDLEDLLYQMVVWLCSHEVLVQLQDYMIAKFPLTTSTTKATTVTDRSNHRHRQSAVAAAAGEHKSDANARLDLGSDDGIVRELWNADCLSGRISIPACGWQTGMDSTKLYQLVARHPHQLRLVTRLPVRGDDWEEL